MGVGERAGRQHVSGSASGSVSGATGDVSGSEVSGRASGATGEYWWRQWVDETLLEATGTVSGTVDVNGGIDPTVECERQLLLLTRLAAGMLTEVEASGARRRNKLQFRMTRLAEFEAEWLDLLEEHGNALRGQELRAGDRGTWGVGLHSGLAYGSGSDMGGRKTGRVGKTTVPAPIAMDGWVDAMIGERQRIATIAAAYVKLGEPRKGNKTLRFVNRAITLMHNQAKVIGREDITGLPWDGHEGVDRRDVKRRKRQNHPNAEIAEGVNEGVNESSNESSNESGNE